MSEKKRGVSHLISDRNILFRQRESRNRAGDSVLLVNELCALIGSGRPAPCSAIGQKLVDTTSPLELPTVQNGASCSGDVQIECLIAHSSCGSSCSRAILVERWTVRVLSAAGSTGLAPLFLKNAIRSHLHFSQLNSWIRAAEGEGKEEGLPRGVACAYRFVRADSDVTFFSSSSDCESELAEHQFPLCRLDRHTAISVAVQYLKRPSMPVPQGLCLAIGSLPTDQWQSPVGSPCSPDERPLMYIDTTTGSENHLSLKPKSVPVPLHSPDGPAAKFSAVDEGRRGRTDSVAVRPARRVLDACLPSANRQEELHSDDITPSTIEGLTKRLDSLVGQLDQDVRGRQRTKSGGHLSFSKVTGLPLHSSPAPTARQRNSLSSSDSLSSNSLSSPGSRRSLLPAGLLGSFEESALHGRLDPATQLDGFQLQIAASGSFSSPHTTLPLRAFYFDLNDLEPLPYLGVCSLESVGRKGYRIPKSGVIQATLFNPVGTVVKLFVVTYDVTDMPACSQTFLRQRTSLNRGDERVPEEREADRHTKTTPRHLQHLIHLRLVTDRRGRLFLHTDIRLLFSQDTSLGALNLETKAGNLALDVSRYTLSSELERPRYSPRK